PPHATSREKPPAPSASRRASGNKSDKAVADFVFVPARQMVHEKLRALYATLRHGQARRDPRSRRRHELRKVFKRPATSSAFSLLLNAEMRKYPSLCAPNPDPGVITTFSSRNIRSNSCQLVRPCGVFPQM